MSDRNNKRVERARTWLLNEINKKKYISKHEWQRGCVEVVPGLRGIPWWYDISIYLGTPMNFLGSSNSRRTMRLFVMNWSIYATKKDSSPIEGQVGQPAIRLKTELVRSRMTPEAGTSSTWCCTIWGLMWTARRYQRQWSSSTNIFLATTITVSLVLSLRRLTS